MIENEIAYSDNRGQNKVVEAEENAKRVRDFYTQNPGSTIKACCEALGLTYKTVRKHLDEMNAVKI